MKKPETQLDGVLNNLSIKKIKHLFNSSTSDAKALLGSKLPETVKEKEYCKGGKLLLRNLSKYPSYKTYHRDVYLYEENILLLAVWWKERVCLYPNPFTKGSKGWNKRKNNINKLHKNGWKVFSCRERVTKSYLNKRLNHLIKALEERREKISKKQHTSGVGEVVAIRRRTSFPEP